MVCVWVIKEKGERGKGEGKREKAKGRWQRTEGEIEEVRNKLGVRQASLIY